ncbi:hypothetical protein H4R18_000180 [Coemansia javaensis]|uniref:Uncharacterized protein n=1 Tax=Coemansia javaensis TaxID=2761396 RepID=A0A9W8LKX9_9FUNG|nr:hypothetical protein H4R18_000180 [Coemansia javaensis]
MSTEIQVVFVFNVLSEDGGASIDGHTHTIPVPDSISISDDAWNKMRAKIESSFEGHTLPKEEISDEAEPISMNNQPHSNITVIVYGNKGVSAKTLKGLAKKGVRAAAECMSRDSESNEASTDANSD